MSTLLNTMMSLSTSVHVLKNASNARMNYKQFIGMIFERIQSAKTYKHRDVVRN